MILEERTYAVKPEHVKDYLAVYQAEGLELQVKYLGNLIGWFTTDIGTVNEVVHLWRYESLGDRETRRAKLEADPAWQAFRAKSSGYLLSMRSRILRPTAFSPMK
jgi:hypothetical protein